MADPHRAIRRFELMFPRADIKREQRPIGYYPLSPEDCEIVATIKYNHKTKKITIERA